ncbi:MAG: RNA-guided pseudouridylation complex pseudouridine synthase subunit Cbf5 [Haloarculaceae archaeon]
MAPRDPPAERSPADLLPFGVVNLDKPPGPSSHQVAGWVRDRVSETLEECGHARGIDRVAHGGTLDPKVTGSLPLLLGDAVRCAQVFDDSRKEYVAVLELHGPAPADFEGTLATFEGTLLQKPPRKSAVSRALRTREVYGIELLDRRERQVLLRIRCESGTYVRKLCHDLGLALGTGAHMGDLRRTATGTFDDTTLSTMEDLVDALAFWAAGDADALQSVVEPAERALVALPRVTIAGSAAREVANGAPVYAPGVLDVEPATRAEVTGDRDQAPSGDGELVACYTPDGAAVCIGRFVGDLDAESGIAVDLERVLV